MSPPDPRVFDLVVFDLDGTLVDSRALILDAMAQGFSDAGQEPPEVEATLAIVGLSLPVAIARLAPRLDAPARDAVVASYKRAFHGLREARGTAESAPLFRGALTLLDRLGGTAVLGIATGKARRGLDATLAAHGIAGHFATTQSADEHPSKPDPSMLHACLAAAGCKARRAVMIGDAVFDIEMGRAAGFRTIGVAWGLQPAERLVAAGADRVVASFAELAAALGTPGAP